MLEKGKINAGEFLILVIVFTIGGTVLVAATGLAGIAKQDSWVADPLTILISLFFIFIYNQLATFYPSMTYVEVNEKIFGKWIGKIAALLYLFYFFILSSGVLREIGDFFTTHILVDTPIQMVMIMFLFTSLIGVRLGLEVICRTALIFFPWIVMMLLMLLLFLIPEIKLENIQPIFGEGMKPIIKGSYHILGLPYLELAILLMVTPYVTEKATMKKAYYRGMVIGGIFLFITVAFCILVLGSEITARQAYPSYILGKKISIGGFIERIEAVVAFIWVFTVYFKLTIINYGLSLGIAQVLGLKSYKILLFPLAFLIITFAIFSYRDIVHFHDFVGKTWTPYSLTICFILPLLLLVIGTIRKKRSAPNTTKH
ncbi:GerAB/ArcD/ProY family transporter [Metabacillus rhizolycopersici]|uniref:Endospore germination permease n=1 Tax=Metabacillus rhizolycopersici TaxID=2875709 RepID=A0ABS7UZP9_9BACI|nr:endospore germination permease [Metabacillus rhizolycopersici]MBZ5753796.1 endospore germination permease [Metabacillus rhizolycopersici]